MTPPQQTDDSKIVVRALQEIAQRLSATIFKFPKTGTMWARAKKRYFCAVPSEDIDGSTHEWKRQLQRWRRGRLCWWEDFDARQRAHEPLGYLDLMNIVKVSVKDN